MAAVYGRKIGFTWDGAPVLGVREKSLTVDGEPVNVTSDEDAGVRLLLTEDAELSVDIELSGATKDSVLREAKINGNVTGVAELTYDNGDVISGTFQLAGYSEGQPYNEAVTFTATLMSSGEVTYTPAAQ